MKSTQASKKSTRDICERIAMLAAHRGLGRQELADKAGVSHMVLHRIKTGTANLRDSTISKFARALGTSVDYLLTGRGCVDLSTAQPCENQAPPRTVAAAIRLLAAQFEMSEDMMRSAIMNAVHAQSQNKTIDGGV